MMLTQADIAEFGQVWGVARQMMQQPQATQQPEVMQQPMQETMLNQNQLPTAQDVDNLGPSTPALPSFEQAMGVVPQETVSLREKLRRRQGNV